MNSIPKSLELELLKVKDMEFESQIKAYDEIRKYCSIQLQILTARYNLENVEVVDV